MRHRAIAAVLGALLVASCAHGQKERSARKVEPAPTARTEAGGKQQGARAGPNRPRVPPTPEGLLGKDAVGKLQSALAQRGLLGPHSAGELDAPTSAAVKRFQEQRGLAATGMPDRETLRDLGVSAEEAYGTGGRGQ